MSILKLPSIVYPLQHLDKTNEIIDVLNDNLNLYYSEENPTLVASGGVCTWTVTHNLGTENVSYSIYEGSNSIIADVSITSENVLTITLNSATNITAKTYSIVVISNGASSSSGGSSITVDEHLSPTSINPVQNKVITNYITPSLSNFLPDGTIINVKTDGSGNYTKLSDAINYLNGKWSNGTVTIQFGDGTFNETTAPLRIGTSNSEVNFNIPCLVIAGNGASNSIIQFNRTTEGDTLEIRYGNVKFKNLTIKNSTFDSSKRYWGLVISSSFTHVSIENCNFENLSGAIAPERGATAYLSGTINITNALVSGITIQITGSVCSNYGVTINFNNCVRGLYVIDAGTLVLSHPTLTFTNTPTKLNVDANTLTAKGIAMGFTV